MIRKALPVGALAGFFALLASITGLASVTTGNVSSESQALAGCSIAGQPGKNYLSGEEEPQLAVSSAGNMIAMFHQDRWSNGGARGIGVSTSSDGVHWTPQAALPDDMCSSPATTPSTLSFYQRSSDPWVSFSKNGDIAYASALSFNAVNNDNAVAAGYSTDGGVSWHMQPILGSIFSQTNQSTDKNSTTADPTDNLTAYTVWDTLFGPTDQPDDNPHAQAYTGPAYFSKTTDGGVHWSTAKVIIDTANRQQTIGNIIVVDPRPGHHTLYDFTDLIVSPNTPFRGARSNDQVAFVKSTDGGDHWTQPQVIAPFNSLGVVDPNNPALRLRVGDGLEEVAIDPISGKLYVVWESSSTYDKNVNQSSSSWDDEIVLAASTDEGATWSGPTVIHKANGKPTYTPTIAVNGNKVAVSYYDNRHLQSQTNVLPTDFFVSISSDGGSTFSEQHVYGPFDQLSAPYARGYFLGDYEGLQPSGGGFEAVFVATNCNGLLYTGSACGPASSNVAPTPNKNPTDVFSAFVS